MYTRTHIRLCGSRLDVGRRGQGAVQQVGHRTAELRLLNRQQLPLHPAVVWLRGISNGLLWWWGLNVGSFGFEKNSAPKKKV